VNVLSHYPSMHYVITGSKGWDYENIFELVSKLNLGGRVHFLGYVPDSDMPAIFNMAKAFAYVSFEEGFGLPLIEARAMDLPVVASDIPVFTEMKLDESVLLTDPNDPGDIGLKFVEAIGIGRNSVSAEFKKYYSWNNTWDHLLQIIASS
jgi:glycosyltransferase involved in cell wall biosynthesis